MAILAGAFVLAITSGPLAAAPSVARTAEFTHRGSMVQQSLSPGYACAMKRALAGRWLACR
jgi:hypothetical protein